jgi:diguanylate cyclase (GGDEF)-like protein
VVDDPGGCESIAVIMIDVDNFKLVNDRHGHPYGDEVLVSLAQILLRNSREGDIVARWGGEEFIVICANLGEDETLEAADKLRKRVEHFHFGECDRITASFGTYWTATGYSDLAPLVGCADIALYAAKAKGRNRAVKYESFLRSAA